MRMTLVWAGEVGVRILKDRKMKSRARSTCWRVQALRKVHKMEEWEYAYVVEMLPLTLDAFIYYLPSLRVSQSTVQIFLCDDKVCLMSCTCRFQQIEYLNAILNTLLRVHVGYMAPFSLVTVQNRVICPSMTNSSNLESKIVHVCKPTVEPQSTSWGK